MRIVGVNGIATHGESNIDLLLLELAQRGHVVIDVPLPKRHWFSARWGGESDGERIIRQSRNGDIVIAHSFGCLRTWYAHQVRDYKAIVCIAPAMDPGMQWRHPERVHCFHSPKDWAVRLGSILVWHPFGPAGVRGFVQDGITNIERACGHNGYFEGPLLYELADYVEELARR